MTSTPVKTPRLGDIRRQGRQARHKPKTGSPHTPTNATSTSHSPNSMASTATCPVQHPSERRGNPRPPARPVDWLAGLPWTGGARRRPDMNRRPTPAGHFPHGTTPPNHLGNISPKLETLQLLNNWLLLIPEEHTRPLDLLLSGIVKHLKTLQGFATPRKHLITPLTI